MNKIYFIIPVYKVEKYLKRCVDSVINQTYKNVHIVLVDDGSPDKCGEICDQYAKEHDNITVIHKENGGLSDARNKGLLYVRENADKDDYLTFLDSDDFVHREFSKILTELMEDNISREEKGKWFDELLQLQEKIAAENIEKHIGKTYKVLCDEILDEGLLSGHTSGTISVEFEGSEELLGKFVNVKIVSYSNAYKGVIVN